MSPPAHLPHEEFFSVPARMTPVPEDKFAFGLWTIGHPGRDPFGDATRPPITPGDFVRGLGRIGAWGVSFHDNDLIPYGASAAEADKIKQDFRRALDETGVVVSMATTNLFFHPCFKDGAFTSNDPEVRRYAISKALNAIDIGAEFGAANIRFLGRPRGRRISREQIPS
jgi:xylose isomerase